MFFNCAVNGGELKGRDTRLVRQEHCYPTLVNINVMPFKVYRRFETLSAPSTPQAAISDLTGANVNSSRAASKST
jgi:hypothetical protein